MQQFIERIEEAFADSSWVQQGFLLPVNPGALDREAIPSAKTVYFVLPLSSDIELQARGTTAHKSRSALVYFYRTNVSSPKSAYDLISFSVEEVVGRLAETGIAVKAYLESDVEVYGFGDIVVTATITEV